MRPIILRPTLKPATAGLALLLGTLAAPPALALDYPNRPVQIIMPFSAGGAPDVLLRTVAQKLSEKWKQGVVIDNRPGGNTFIGTVAATKAAPDGYTLLMTADQTFVLNPVLYNSLPYSMKDLKPVIMMASIPNILVTANKVPASNVKELIALAKAKPETLTYGSTGPGSIQRLSAEYFANLAGIKLVHIPYKGANETTTAILAGEIDMTVTGMSNALPHIGSGKLKALAIGTEQRNPLAPDVPTMQEAGVPGYVSQGTFGLFALNGTPPEIIAKLNADIAEVLAMPEVRKALEARSFVVRSAGPAQFQTFIDQEIVKWRTVIEKANIKIN